MKSIFDEVSIKCSRTTTHAYSTSFSIGIFLLDRKIRDAIYSIYGFVRFADEIVDSFHDYDKGGLLETFRLETHQAIKDGISLNPILNSFQNTVRLYGIEASLIDTFLDSMALDLTGKVYQTESFRKYILGSAEVVGLMCLRVFCEGDNELYLSLKAPAMRLGAAFQKVNFLRDLRDDMTMLERSYFPNVEVRAMTPEQKRMIEAEIRDDFAASLPGIMRLPQNARLGVYVAYVYYRTLLNKIESASEKTLLTTRVRVPNHEKFRLLVRCCLKHNLGML